MRVRAVIALLSRELFGIELALPEFPVLKGIRGIGMSDSPALAARLAEKFDYTNTFYHQAPFFDVTKLEPRDEGRFDFILSSEVMEHVPAPIEHAFATLSRLLQPNGVLLLTTPYTIDGKTREHFPELHEYTLASPGGKTILVNRRRDGTLETFENLLFHGGHGSTLELRVFSEDSLREVLEKTGFPDIHVASENSPAYGIEHEETWSLPISARKGTFAPPATELASQYRDAFRLAQRMSHDRTELQADYDRYIEFHKSTHDQMQRDLAARNEWAHSIERTLDERTRWALSLQQEKKDLELSLAHAQNSEREAWEALRALEKELDETRAARIHLERRRWTRVGRKLRAL